MSSGAMEGSMVRGGNREGCGEWHVGSEGAFKERALGLRNDSSDGFGHEGLESIFARLQQDDISLDAVSNSFSEVETALMELITISRTSHGREMLAEFNVIPLLLTLLEKLHLKLSVGPSSACENLIVLAPTAEVLDVLLLLLKLLRNLCAGDASNQDAFLVGGGVAVLVPIAKALVLIFKYTHSSITSYAETPVAIATMSIPNSEGDGEGGGDASQDSEVRSRSDENTSVADIESVSEQIVDLSLSSALPSTSEQGALNCLQALLQLLGNFARRGESSQVAVWQKFFPNVLTELASLSSVEVFGPLCMLLHTCCQGSRNRLWQLCQDEGAALIALLIVPTTGKASGTSSTNGSVTSEKFDWFELLVRQICSTEPLFPLLFTNLGQPRMAKGMDPSEIDGDQLPSVCGNWMESSTFTSVQADLLYILLESLSDELDNISKSDFAAGEREDRDLETLPMPLKSMCFVVVILRKAVKCCVERPDPGSVPLLNSASHLVQILGFTLLLLRIFCAWNSSSLHHVKTTTDMLSHGLVDLLLSMLEALGPPKAHDKETVLRGEHPDDRISNGPVPFPCKSTYQGYRRDIVAVIANVAYRNNLVQDHVRKRGKLLLVLQQCRVEKESPFLREWSLWAMRNLLEGSLSNQKEIEDLEIKEPLNIPELGRMGLNVEIDQVTRRPRLVNSKPMDS